MIQDSSFQRKVIYLICIALLLIPLYMIGNPATGDPSDPESKPGGKLAQLRAEYDLSQAELGEIDPASESMKLATLGMRGVAANILWSKANEYRKKENWEALVAVVNQMAKLQPHFVSVWEFQSHNLSYNISVEHDDYRFRYQWVKKGIDFLIEGTRYNRREPKLFWTVGWYTGQKFGRADEHRQFRGLFSDDQDFHDMLSQYVAVDSEGRGASGAPDNWLVSRLWYNKAYDIIDTQGVPLRGKAPHIFYADGPKAQMNYASAIESEGYLDEKAEYAWRRGGDEWDSYGTKLFPSSWGENLRLNEKEAKEVEAERLRQELEELVPNGRDEVVKEKKAKLSPDELAAIEKGPQGITEPEEYANYWGAVHKTKVEPLEIAAKAPEAISAQAFHLAEEVEKTDTTVYRIGRYRENVNFDYWRTRCEVEQMPEAVEARRHIFQANEYLDEVLLDQARKEFELAWEGWGKILETHPALVEDLMLDDLRRDMAKYLDLLDQLDEELAEDFPLRNLLERFNALSRNTEESAEAAPQ